MVFLISATILLFMTFIENKRLFQLSIIIVGLYYSLTFAYGYDWMNYYDTYLDVQRGYYNSFFIEPGYLIFMRLSVFLGMDFPVFSSIVTALMYIMVYSFCIRLKSPNLAFFTIFCFLSFFMFTEQIRQGIALCIILYAMQFIAKEKKLLFVFYVIIASFFHISAILTLLYLFMLKSNKASMIKFMILSFILTSVLLYSLYNPALFSWIPFVGDKISAYAYLFSDKNIGFWTYVFQSKLIYLYFLLFVLLYLKRDANAGIFSGVGAVFFLFLSRLSSFLVRIGYYFVPFLIISVDGFMSQSGKGSKMTLFKFTYVIIVYSIATIPLWNPLYREGASNHLSVFSQQKDINNEIGRKCTILRKYYEDIVITRCL
ncbi:EpsG family protein [Klebsiella quasipneumoniae]|uniref:EpsG family protein n=2 Tax=Klebsiella quasipneumoniae TaxID=1463165 RepID=UPI0013EFA283